MNKIASLIYKYIYGEITADEQRELDQWIKADRRHEQYFKEAIERRVIAKKLGQFAAIDVAAGYEKFVLRKQPTTKPQPVKIPFWKRHPYWTAAASITVLATLVAAYLLTSAPGTTTTSSPAMRTLADIVKTAGTPPFRHAQLVLDDGNIINLMDSTGKRIPDQGSYALTNEQARISYKSGKGTGGNEPVFNTVITARGTLYQVLLPDGTKVWLNNETSVRYAVGFSGKERRVEVIGEAYFDVAKDPNKPFIVKHMGIEIKVLGTKFNTNGYADDTGITTTLLEGKIKMRNQRQEIFIDSVARVHADTAGPYRYLPNDNLPGAIDWTEGYLELTGKSFTEILRKIERWYNITVKYPPGLQDLKLRRRIPLSTSIQGIRKFLAQNLGNQFQVELSEDEKVLIIKP